MSLHRRTNKQPVFVHFHRLTTLSPGLKDDVNRGLENFVWRRLTCYWSDPCFKVTSRKFPSLNVAAITQGPNLISRMTEMDRKLAGAKGAK